MKWYLFRIDYCYGNDNTVYDLVVTAESKDSACDNVAEYFDSQAAKKNWESDGNFCSYYYPCDCDEIDSDFGGDCSHGGLLVGDNPEEYLSEELARAAGSIYHSNYEIEGMDKADTAEAEAK